MDLNSLLTLARQTTDFKQVLRTQLLWMLALRIILYTLLLAISYVFSGGPFDVIVLPGNLLVIFILTVYITTLFSAFYLQIYRGSLRRYGFIQTLIDTFFVSILVFFSGGINSVFTTVYFFPIISGGLLLPRKGGLVAAAASTLLYAAILYLETRGFYPSYIEGYHLVAPSSSAVVLNHFAVHGLTFFLAAVLSALFGLRLQKTENALSDSLRNFDQLAILYKQVFDNISTGIMTIDGANRITSANNAILKITSIHPQELIGQELATTFPNFDLSQVDSRMAADFTKSDGTTLRIGYSNMLIQKTTEEHQQTAEPAQKIITLQDISELEKLERQVRQAEKLAAIGTMSASIAHDFRNPLTAISGSAQILAAEFSSAGTKHHADFELIHIILRESGRLIDTIADFLKFSRPEHTDCTWFSLRNCLEEVLHMCKADPAWPPDSQIRLYFKDTIDVWADEKQLFTVFTHLIQNALAFCPTGRERIEISAEEKSNPGIPDTIQIIIKDNGPGVDDAMREQIFEPFYTSRPEGTGLGLAVTKQALEAHNGSITVEKGHTGGAQFILVLPLPH